MSVARLELPSRDPGRQAAAERLALLVEGAGDGGTALRLHIEHAPRAGIWFGGADGIALRIDEIAGAAVALHPERVDDAVAALDRLEPLLDLIEAATGWVVEPDATLERPPEASVVLRVHATRDGVRGAVFALAVPDALASSTAARMPVATERSAGIPLLCRLRASVVSLPVEESRAIAAGDLLVLEPAPWRATLQAAPLGNTDILFDPGTGRAISEGSNRVSNGEPDASDAIHAFRVPIDVNLHGGAATLGELGALREGGAVQLGPVVEGLRVTLSVGGRPLCTGEVVRLGERFAVIVETLADGAAAPEANG